MPIGEALRNSPAGRCPENEPHEQVLGYKPKACSCGSSYRVLLGDSLLLLVEVKLLYYLGDSSQI